MRPHLGDLPLLAPDLVDWHELQKLLVVAGTWRCPSPVSRGIDCSQGFAVA